MTTTHDAQRAMKIFFKSELDEHDRKEWFAITGQYDLTTKVLWDTIRASESVAGFSGLGAAVSASPQPSEGKMKDAAQRCAWVADAWAMKNNLPTSTKEAHELLKQAMFDEISKFFAAAPAKEPREKAIVKTVWMDSIHFYDHLEHDPRAKGLPVYKSADICKADNPCIDTDGHCTALKVFISDVDLWAAQEQPVESHPKTATRMRDGKTVEIQNDPDVIHPKHPGRPDCGEKDYPRPPKKA